MAVVVMGANLVAARLASMAHRASDVAEREAEFTAGEIVDDWQAHIPVGPTGMTGSEASNYVEKPEGSKAGTVEVAAVSSHFVINFLQQGTVHMSPKVDLFGVAHPHVERWSDRIAKDIG